MAKQTVDPQDKLVRLEERHKLLKKQVEVLEARTFLTPTERRQATDLKKRKLATKDAISALKARLN